MIRGRAEREVFRSGLKFGQSWGGVTGGQSRQTDGQLLTAGGQHDIIVDGHILRQLHVRVWRKINMVNYYWQHTK